MEFREVLRHRRMIRTFEARAVPDAMLRRLLRAAQRAPSAGHTQPLELVVTRDAGIRRGLAAASWSRGARPDAGDVTVVFCGDLLREAERYGTRGAGKYMYTDVAFAALLFVLGLPPHVVPVGMVILGYGDEPPRPRPWRRLREIVHHDRYAPAYDWTPRRLPPRPQ